MDTRIAEELRRHGVVTRRFCVRHGMTPVQIDGLLRSGVWVAVRRGVYTTAVAWEALDEYVGQPLLRCKAASAAMFTPHMLSHDSAGLLLGLTVLHGHEQPVHVTRFEVLGSRHEHGVRHHRAPWTPDQLAERDGYLCLDAPRTVADIARDRGLDAGLVTADSALRAGTTRTQLRAAVEAMPSWPGVTLAREVVEMADAGAESAIESVARRLVTDLGRGRPETQTGLSDGSRTVWCDLRLARHVFEVDGKIKLRLVAEGGFATKSPAEVAWDEKLRRDFVQSYRLGVSRIVDADLWGARRSATLTRLAREVDETARLFGTDTADLAPYLVTRSRLPRAS